MIDAIDLTILFLVGTAIAMQWVVILRERPVLVPVLVFGTFAMVIVGATLMVAARAVSAVPWFVPMGVLLISYLVYRLYEAWGT